MRAINSYVLLAALLIIAILGILLHTERSKRPVIVEVMPNSIPLCKQDYHAAPPTLNPTIAPLLDNKLLNETISTVWNNAHINNTISSVDNICHKSTPRAIRCWNSSTPFVFMHVGKNGGQSFDYHILPIVKELGGKYIGFDKHFDWSGVAKENRDYIAILLRHPVERLISHFYFSKICPWTEGSPIRQTSLHDYLMDYQLMLDTYQIWQDGAAGAVWLTGNLNLSLEYLEAYPRKKYMAK